MKVTETAGWDLEDIGWKSIEEKIAKLFKMIFTYVLLAVFLYYMSKGSQNGLRNQQNRMSKIVLLSYCINFQLFKGTVASDEFLSVFEKYAKSI